MDLDLKEQNFGTKKESVRWADSGIHYQAVAKK